MNPNVSGTMVLEYLQSWNEAQFQSRRQQYLQTSGHWEHRVPIGTGFQAIVVDELREQIVSHRAQDV